MDSISESADLGEWAVPTDGDRVLAALIWAANSGRFGDEPTSRVPPSIAIAPAARLVPPTFLDRLEALKGWQLAILAVGVGIGLGWGIAAIFGAKATTAAAVIAAAAL